MKIVLYTIGGKRLLSSVMDKDAQDIDISQYFNGTYLLEVSVNGKSATFKIIKK